MKKYDKKSSVSNMIKELGWESLAHRRDKHSLECFYLVYNKIGGWAELREWLSEPNFKGHNDHQCKVKQIRAQTDSYLNSFMPKTIKAWNALNRDIFTQCPNTLGNFRYKMHINKSENVGG